MNLYRWRGDAWVDEAMVHAWANDVEEARTLARALINRPDVYAAPRISRLLRLISLVPDSKTEPCAEITWLG